jgi:hypothetical protein
MTQDVMGRRAVSPSMAEALDGMVEDQTRVQDRNDE